MTDDIRKLCEKYEICGYEIVDGKVNANGGISIITQQLTHIPVPFGTVSGSFRCYSNQLTTLDGCPQTVHGNFLCYQNRITTLVGGPKEVHGDFLCHSNQLTSLVGCPQTVKGDFWCSKNHLTSLDGAPQTVRGNFLCNYNQLSPDEIFKWHTNSVFHGNICSDHVWLDEFLNCKQKDHKWTCDYKMLLRKYCNV